MKLKLSENISSILFSTASSTVQCSVVSDSLQPMDCQAPLSMEFFRKEYWGRLPFLSPGNLPHPGMEPRSPVSPTWQADSLPVSYLGSPRSDVMKVAQLCQTLCDPMDYTVHGILQVRILEWVAFPFSRGSFQSADSLPAEPQGKPIK